MTRPSATCELFLDGVRVPDTGPDLILAQPTALDGLTLTWGRDGANEQPGPGTCSFVILNRYAESDFLDRAHVGSAVTVWAEGATGSGGGGDEIYTQTMDDGTFDSYPLGNANWSWYGYSYAMNADIVDYPGRGRVFKAYDFRADTPLLTIPPRAYVVETMPPDVWDSIPRRQDDQEPWQLTLDLWVPDGLAFTLSALPYTAPYRESHLAPGTPTHGVGTGDWQTVSATTDAAMDDVWIALQVSVDRTTRGTWAEAAGTWAEAVGTWQGHGDVIYADNGFIGLPAGTATTRRVLSFSGKVTDITATPEGDDTLRLQVTAADLGAELSNRVIGDNPWPAQSVGTRVDRIETLAALPANAVLVDAPLYLTRVSYRDVDAQPVLGLLQDLAQTAGGVLWTATHATKGAYLWMENPDRRAALRELEETGGVIVITGDTANATLVSACDLLEEPVRWTQDTQDVATVVAVTWLEQGVDDEGLPMTTERTTTVTDAAAIEIYGTRRLSVSTELTYAADAALLANRLLAQARAVAWRVEGLTLDTDAGPEEIASVDDSARANALLNMLDGTIRMGLGVVLVDMPAYAPRGAISQVYVEGGTYRFERGAWTLALNAAPAAAQGSSVTWGQLDAAWTWAQWSAAITYQDLYGVGP